MTFLLTATAHSAFLPPSTVVTVIFELPSLIAVSFAEIDPVDDTTASTATTPGAELLHDTSLSVASCGAITAVSVATSPSVSERLVLSRLTLTTGCVTATSQRAILPPSLVTAVTVALPLVFPVTYPFSSTLATFVLLLVQVTVLSVALSGLTVAFS